MGENTLIEWCDHSWGPWEGCTKVSQGCKNCYAETRAKRFKTVEWGAAGLRRRTSENYWKKLARWNNQTYYECRDCGWRGHKVGRVTFPASMPTCGGCGLLRIHRVRPRVFCAPLADVFEDKPDQPELESWRGDFLSRVEENQDLDHLLLTKRPENVNPMIKRNWWGWGGLPDNVWIGASIENQETADKRIPELLGILAAVHFLSIEPLLGDLGEIDLAGIDLVIVGGESGPNARPMHLDWVRSIRDQCQAAGVAFFFKQWGEWLPFGQRDVYGHLNIRTRGENPKFWHDFGDGNFSVRVGKKNAGRLLDGRIWN